MKELPKELTPELLSDVLGNYVKDSIRFSWLDESYLDGEYLIFGKAHGYESYTQKKVNLDTLTRLCKEWCYKESKVWLMSYITALGANCRVFKSDLSNRTDEMFIGDTELEAVLKAVQWVRDNK